jgi:hypothetical protein
LGGSGATAVLMILERVMTETPLGPGKIYAETVVWAAPGAENTVPDNIVLLGRRTRDGPHLADRVQSGMPSFRGIPRRRALFSEVGMRISFMISDVPAPMV